MTIGDKRLLMTTLASFAAMTAAGLAFSAWSGFSSDSAHIAVPAVVGVVVLLLTGTCLRAARLPAGAVASAQFVVALLLGIALVAESFPTPGALEVTLHRLSDSVEVTSTYPPPVPEAGGGVGPLMVVIILTMLWVVDTLAAAYRVAPVVGIPLLAVYSIPTTLLDTGSTVWWGVASAVAFLALLAVAERSDVDHWGRPHRHPSSDGLIALPVAAPVVGVAAVTAALALPLVVPVLDLGLLDNVGGEGVSSDSVVISEPAANLQGDLQRGEDVPLLRVSTQDRGAAAPRYVQIGVLPTYDAGAQEWTSGDLEDRPIGEGLTVPEGVRESDPRTDWEFEATDRFRSRWLPTIDDVVSLRADDQWRYRPAAGDFTREDDTTAGQSWTVTSIDQEITSEDLAGADGSHNLPDVYTDTSGVSAEVGDLAERVVEAAGAQNGYESAVALQQFFRDTDEFTYDLEASAEGDDTLTEFLFDTRTGFCQHFASAMAVMARELGIPSRVVVGLLNARSTGANSWEFTAHSLHSWPELYFEGVGWVMFEPTPGQRAASVPSYSNLPQEQPAPTAPESSSPPTSQPPTSSTGPQLPEEPSSTATPEAGDDAAGRGDDERTFAWVTAVAIAGGVLLVVALALVPSLLRRRRRARHRSQGAEGAWRELRHSYLDHRLDWPEGLSPAATARILIEDWAASSTPVAEDAVRGLELLVGGLERERYAPPGTRVDVPDGLVDGIVTARVASTPARRRILASALPRSLWRERDVASDDDANERAALGDMGDMSDMDDRAVRVDRDDDLESDEVPRAPRNQ